MYDMLNVILIDDVAKRSKTVNADVITFQVLVAVSAHA